MKVKISFDKTTVERRGHTLEAMQQTVKSLFAIHGLPCIAEDSVLTFADKGHGDDFAVMWGIILALLRTGWFMDCTASCVWQDENGEEDILSQVGKISGTV